MGSVHYGANHGEDNLFTPFICIEIDEIEVVYKASIKFKTQADAFGFTHEVMNILMGNHGLNNKRGPLMALKKNYEGKIATL